jgi:ribosomal protein L7/L12
MKMCLRRRELLDEYDSLVSGAGNKLLCIKMIREVLSLGLKDAKDLIEDRYAELRS